MTYLLFTTYMALPWHCLTINTQTLKIIDYNIVLLLPQVHAFYANNLKMCAMLTQHQNAFYNFNKKLGLR